MQSAAADSAQRSAKLPPVTGRSFYLLLRTSLYLPANRPLPDSTAIRPLVGGQAAQFLSAPLWYLAPLLPQGVLLQHGSSFCCGYSSLLCDLASRHTSYGR